jgi:hypothetical protein
MQNLGNLYIWGSPFVMSRTDAQNWVEIIFKCMQNDLRGGGGAHLLTPPLKIRPCCRYSWLVIISLQWHVRRSRVLPMCVYPTSQQTDRYQSNRSLLNFQVEHPCTEMIADINLPADQLQVWTIIWLTCWFHRKNDTKRTNFHYV